jgi:hypothetical protein
MTESLYRALQGSGVVLARGARPKGSDDFGEHEARRCTKGCASDSEVCKWRDGVEESFSVEFESCRVKSVDRE